MYVASKSEELSDNVWCCCWVVKLLGLQSASKCAEQFAIFTVVRKRVLDCIVALTQKAFSDNINGICAVVNELSSYNHFNLTIKQRFHCGNADRGLIIIM